MVEPLVRVVDYGTYRLRNRNRELSRRDSIDIYHLKQLVEGLNSTLELFNGAHTVRFLSFIATFHDKIETLGTSEAVAVRVLGNFLGGDAKYVH